MRTLDTTGWPLEVKQLTSKNKTVCRFVAINDPHLSIHTPPSYKVEYWPVIKAAIETVFRFAEAQDCDGILWSGDVFNLKSPQRNPPGFIAQVIALLRSTNIPHWAIFGNHDIKFGHLEQGLPGQPIEVLYEAGIFNLLDKHELVVNAGDHTTKIAGSSFRHGLAEPCRLKKKNGNTHLITLGHFWFGTETGNFFGEPIWGPDYLGDSETDLYIIGHHHEDQGVQVFDGKQYASVGSITRTGAHKNDLSRRPAALFIQTTAGGIETKILRPKMPPAEDILDLVKREQIVKEKEEMSKFIASLRVTQGAPPDPRSMLATMQCETAVRELVEGYLDRAEAEE